LFPCTGENMVRMTYVSEYLAKFTIIKTDRMPALTGISKKVYDLLWERPLLSLEIKSADNINALLHAEPGTHVFLTPTLREDLLPKAEGIICELRDKKISLQKMKKWDEIEITAMRIQLKPVCMGRAKTIEKKALGEGVAVDVERTVRCSIS
jgi:hypothetical protein